jgi:hypothetical protein
MALLLGAPHVLAFKEPGHRAIERFAYEQLVNEGHAEVLSTLIRAGALRAALPVLPEKIDADPNAYIGLKEGDLNVHGVWVGSHIPDHSFERQLQSYGQCFHFNARGADVDTSRVPKGRYQVIDPQTGKAQVAAVDLDMPLGMVRDAYLRCMSLMDILVRGVVADPVDAHARNVGLHTVIHLVADSFSDAHTARTRNWSILYVKPWRLRTWVPNLLPWNWIPLDGDGSNASWKHFLSDDHHGVMDDRDYEYVKDTPGCDALKDNPGRLELTCLTPRAKKAADAVVDLLILVAEYVDHPPLQGERPLRLAERASANGDAGRIGFEEAWNKYKKKYFAHYLTAYTPQVSTSPTHATRDFVARARLPESPPIPGAVVGIALDLQSPSDNLWIEGNLLRTGEVLEEEHLHVLNYLTHTIQVRFPLETPDGQRPFGIAYELGGQVPGNLSQSDWLALKLSLRLRFAYGVSRISTKATRHMFEAGLGGFAIDAIVRKKVWVGTELPRITRRLDTWGPEKTTSYWSIKVGYALP